MSPELRLICWPFHNGLRNVSMGLGSARLVADPQFRRGIEAAGWTLAAEEVDGVDESQPEIARVVELLRHLASQVDRAASSGAFPLVLAGNCNSCLATVAGIGADDLGVVWFDAHADFDDPEENTSGFFDVMGLAMLTGRGWRALRNTIPGHRPVAERHVILAGVRDLEPNQCRRLERSMVRAINGAIDPEQFQEALSELSASVSRIYLHVDLDALDISEARANEYSAAGGPTLDHLVQCIRSASRQFVVAAAAITAYDPAFDQADTTLAAARRIASEIAAGVRSGRT